MKTEQPKAETLTQTEAKKVEVPHHQVEKKIKL